jgi:hypothetical protein
MAGPDTKKKICFLVLLITGSRNSFIYPIGKKIFWGYRQYRKEQSTRISCAISFSSSSLFPWSDAIGYTSSFTKLLSPA